jgi:hypothetical protein
MGCSASALNSKSSLSFVGAFAEAGSAQTEFIDAVSVAVRGKCHRARGNEMDNITTAIALIMLTCGFRKEILAARVGVGVFMTFSYRAGGS